MSQPYTHAVGVHTIGTAIAELRAQNALITSALLALETLAQSYGVTPDVLDKPRVETATRKAVTHVPTSKKPTRAAQAPPAMPVPMGGVRGRVLSALRARGTATTREIAENRGCTVSSASSSLQALAKKGYCTLAGKTWTAVSSLETVDETQFETVWNGTKERNGEASIVAPRDRKAG